MRQRLIGAAVLVIVAIVLIPWLVSNSHPPREQVRTLPVPVIASAGRPTVLELPALPAADTVPASAIASTVAAAVAASVVMHATGKKEEQQALQRQAVPPAAEPTVATPVRATVTATSAQPAVNNKEQAATSKSAEKSDNRFAKERTIKPGDWFLQVASFTSRKNAQQMVDTISKSGFNTSIEAHAIEGKTWYRVRVGPYASQSLARAALRRVATVSRTHPIVRQADGSGE